MICPHWAPSGLKKTMTMTIIKKEASSEKYPVNILMILDGWGINDEPAGNAVAQAKTPFLDHLVGNFPNSRLDCSGNAVGLPNGTMGNSEVGHMNMGAGRKVLQNLVRINTAIDDKSFFENSILKKSMDSVKKKDKVLHLMGLLSDGGVHSHISHLFALIDMARQNKVTTLYIHPILDGRDTSPTAGLNYIKQLQQHLDLNNYGKIASIVGRYWAMDRDTRWDRVEKAYRLFTEGEGKKYYDPIQAIQDAYDSKVFDEFIPPISLGIDSNSANGSIQDGDGLIFFNFRADRAKEITRAFNEKNFQGFKREFTPKLSCFVTMTQYDETFGLPIVFGPQPLTDIFGEILNKNGIPQLRIAETEKYAHVTYFFNGGNEAQFDLEKRVLIPSPRDVATYDEKPAMSAFEVAEKACELIDSGNFQFVVLNFANMDMVGHTGILKAAIKACETVDTCVKQVVETIWKTRGTAFITADHGNSEQMISPDGSPHTAHTLNQVRFIVAGKNFKDIQVKNGILGDIAPTILKALGMEQPEKMTGISLI